jgi:hypothetical protein
MRRATAVRAAAACATAALAAPGAAQGATFSVAERSATGDVVRYEAAPGETNDVTIRDVGGEYVVRETNAPLFAGEGCRASAPGEVTCPGRAHLHVRLGDGPDDARWNLAVRTPDGLARLIFVEAGDGEDALDGNGVLEGGPGRDSLSGTAAGELIRGGDGDDALTGLEGDDALDGGDGEDLVEGDEGDDLLTGGRDRDRFQGRDGNDVLDLRPAPTRDELIGCGPGSRDAIAGSGWRLFVPRECELVVAGADDVVLSSRPVRLRRGVATYRARCARPVGAARCPVRLDLGRLGRSGTARVVPGRSSLVAVRLTTAGRTAARRARKVRVRVLSGTRRATFVGTLRPQ